ncbi:glycosyltransferase family 2 protein [Thiosulfatimonas sediminis]|uniref:glycosyltransferase family 2 protein n=1 Tax=Thiosulfatimonas sediminis TaxID=2675054 RepID=UPI001564EFA3|nr:glycosyltransferase family 2 protein [Thiosulfatimonas sediminis]
MEDTPAYFKCYAESGTKWPKRWVVVKGLLLRQCTGYDAKLVFKLKGGKTFTYKLPITLKGKIFEVVHFPANIEKIYFEPMSSKGRFQMQDFQFKSISWFERNYLMSKRLYLLYKSQNQDVIYKAGIRWHQFIFDLSKAYEIAGRFRAYSPKIEYKEWLKLFDQLNHKDIFKIKRLIKKNSQLPEIELLELGHQTEAISSRAIQNGLSEQLYSRFKIVKKSDLSYEFYQHRNTRWLMLVEEGCQLRPHALYWFAHQACLKPNAAMIYSDHDYIDENGERCSPVLKPEWSPEFFLSQNFIGGVLMVNTDYLDLESCKNLTIYAVILRLFSRLKPYQSDGLEVCRIPALLFSKPLLANNQKRLLAEGVQETELLTKFFNKHEIIADISDYHLIYKKIVYAVKARPLVSIIIPTRDMLHHLERCVESLLTKTSYDHFEIIIVDNQSEELETSAYFAKVSALQNVNVVEYNKPFNYSAINNYAAKYCNGEVFCLLNNDTEVISPDWLEVMLGQLQQSNVGAVGIKLLFPDGTVQHAGDAVGPGGCADHFFSGFEEEQAGYMGRAIVAQDLSAVTAACLLTQRDVFESLNGLDERHLSVAFNDVDYCLRVREKGMRVVFTPYVKMYHHESVSRGKDDNPEKIARAKKEADYIRSRWGHVLKNDPFYNPNLNYARPNFELSRYPMVKKPWLKR